MKRSIIFTILASSLATACASSDSPTLPIRDAALDEPGRISLQVSTSTDDAEEEEDGAVDLTSSDLELGQEGTSPQLVGIRFGSAGVPGGATITSARLQLTTDEVSTAPTSVTIQAHRSARASAFASTNRNLSSRPLTAASVSWEPASWPTVGASTDAQRSPELRTLLQELVDQPDWDTSSDIVLLIAGTGRRTAESFDGKSSAAPQLIIQFEDDGASPPPGSCDVLTEPGSIAGVEPESLAQLSPVRDANGTLYRLTESEKSDGNNPRMMKSSDGGSTWAEVDAANRPEARDLEGLYQVQHGSALYYSMNLGTRTVWVSFNTSDAASSPDRWVAEETVASGYDKSSAQYSSLVRLDSGEFWIFYSFTEDGRSQIGFRKRTGPDQYGSEQRLASAGGDWSGPRAVAAGDRTYVVYKDDAGDALYLRTLSATGTLSSPRRVDQNGTNSVPVPHLNPVVYQRDGQEVVEVAFAGADERLRSVSLVDDELTEEQLISSSPVLSDADVVENEGAVGNLSRGGDATYIVWTDEGSGDILWRRNASSGGLGPIETFWQSSNEVALYVYCSVFEDDGCRKLGCTYDVGPHDDDVGQIEYRELALPE